MPRRLNRAYVYSPASHVKVSFVLLPLVKTCHENNEIPFAIPWESTPVLYEKLSLVE